MVALTAIHGGIFDYWCPLSQHPHYIDMKIALTFTGGTLALKLKSRLGFI